MHRFIALAFFSALAVADPAHAQVAVTILHTSEHHGTIQPIEHGPFAGLGGVERRAALRSEEHTSELQSQSNLVCRLLSSEKHTSNSSHSQISYAVFCLKKKKGIRTNERPLRG